MVGQNPPKIVFDVCRTWTLQSDPASCINANSKEVFASNTFVDALKKPSYFLTRARSKMRIVLLPRAHFKLVVSMLDQVHGYLHVNPNFRQNTMVQY